MGLWFAGSAIGNGLAGLLGLCWDRWPHHRYFAALAAVSLAAAVPLLSRRRYLDWLTALSVNAATQHAVGNGTQAMNPNLESITLPLATPATLSLQAGPAYCWWLYRFCFQDRWWRTWPHRCRCVGVSAIVCGLAVLCLGPFLFAQSLMRWAGRCISLAG